MARGKYLTPDALSGAVVCRPLFIPVELLPYFDGALEELTRPQNWELFGDLTVTETVDYARSIIDAYYVDDCEDLSMSDISIERSEEWVSWTVVTGNAISAVQLQVGLDTRSYYRQNAAAINDKLRFSPYLDAGVWRLTVKAAVGSTMGIQHIQVGGTDYGLLDWYNSIFAHGVYQSCYFPVAAAGVTNIDSLISTKNAASSAYNIYGERFWLEKQ